MARRLAAIMFTDLVGSTELAQKDEKAALALLREQEALAKPLLEAHGGRLVKTTGDGMLIEFANARDAVEYSVDFQRTVQERQASDPTVALHVRIGIHVGDVESQGADILGDAVNIAARVEPLAEPGGVCLSGAVYEQTHNKVAFSMERLGPKTLKGVVGPVEIYRVVLPWQRVGDPPPAELDRTRIAVLPFANMSPDPNDEYFADGITDEIISAVSGISGLSVISRTSTMRYKQTSKALTEIGRELKAGKILEGSVRKFGSRVRITVQLIDSESDAHVWSRSYDGSMDHVFETQSDIARRIAEALKLPLPQTGARVENPEVYTQCLRARLLWQQTTKDANGRATILLEDALRIDPGSARAIAGLALCSQQAGDEAWSDQKAAYAKARELAERAVELDPMLPEARHALGNALMQDDYPAAEVEFRKALALNPSYADAHERLGSVLRGMGRHEEALEEVRRAYELDPLPTWRTWLLATQYYFVGRNDESLALFDRLVQTEGLGGARWARAVLMAIKGRKEEAYRALEPVQRLSSEMNYKSVRARVEGHLGNKEEASRLIGETLSLIGDSDSPDANSARWSLSYACALIGDTSHFYPLVNHLVDRKIMGPGELGDPAYNNLREQARFVETVKKMRASYGIVS